LWIHHKKLRKTLITKLPQDISETGENQPPSAQFKNIVILISDETVVGRDDNAHGA
jgi:hypothetical protein